jgi:hypothetical protein
VAECRPGKTRVLRASPAEFAVLVDRLTGAFLAVPMSDLGGPISHAHRYKSKRGTLV